MVYKIFATSLYNKIYANQEIKLRTVKNNYENALSKLFMFPLNQDLRMQDYSRFSEAYKLANGILLPKLCTVVELNITLIYSCVI